MAGRLIWEIIQSDLPILDRMLHDSDIITRGFARRPQRPLFDDEELQW